MKIYFSSARPAALKVNGVFCGATDGFRRYLDLFPQDRPFLEWLPETGFTPLRFFLDDGLFARPPKGVAVCRIPEGVALHAVAFDPDGSGKLEWIREWHTAQGTLTVYRQCGTYAVLQGKTLCLPNLSENCILREGEGFFVLSEGRTVWAATGERVLYRGEADDLQIDRNTLAFTAPLHDLRGRTARWEWSVENPPRRRIVNAFGGRELPEPYFLCGLMENLSEGEDPSCYADAELCARTDQLKAYFGNYIAVRPCGKDLSGGVCPVREGAYELRVFRAERTDGKISNVLRIF